MVTRYSERLVDQGFCQLEGLDYDETFSLLLDLRQYGGSLLMLHSKKFKVYQMDINIAFLHEYLQEEVFLK